MEANDFAAYEAYYYLCLRKSVNQFTVAWRIIQEKKTRSALAPSFGAYARPWPKLNSKLKEHLVRFSLAALFLHVILCSSQTNLI